jgi:phenylalanyl-tRNA synthetase beta chain
MKVPVSWLREYVDAPADPAALAKLLVAAGVGVEGVEGEVLDLEITANRADLLSLLGVAREVGVNLRKPVKAPAPAFAPSAPAVGGAWSVQVADPALCPRYTLRGVLGVKVGLSPPWLAARVEAAGVRSINNVVDVTNYVLLELGQPLHAFDAKLLKGGAILVRRAAPGEKIAAIDAKTYELTKDMLVIADAARPVAIAGVMGGKDTEITAATVDVLIESAQFDPVSVRRTGRRLGLSSDASYRFERGVDADGVDLASRRAVELILQVAGGKAMEGVVDVSVPRPARAVARVRPARVSKVLGMAVPAARVREILAGLGAEVKGSDDALEVTSPSNRRDLKIEVDYIEEVARIEGYDRIPADTGFGLAVAMDRPEDLVAEEIRATLAGLGAYEALTWSFAPAGAPNRVPFWTEDALLPLRDPQGAVDRTLRSSLAPGLLEVLATNEGYKEALRPVFEISRVYYKAGKDYADRTVLGLAAPGDPLVAKGLVETVAARLGLKIEVVPAAFPWLEAGAELRLGGKRIGYLGTAGPGLSGLRSPAAIAELDFDALVPGARLVRKAADFNRQPPVERDLNVVLPESATWAAVESAVRAAAPPTLEATAFLNEYRGKGIEAGRKSWAFSMRFRAPDRTLTAAEVDASVKGILEALASTLGGRLR